MAAHAALMASLMNSSGGYDSEDVPPLASIELEVVTKDIAAGQQLPSGAAPQTAMLSPRPARVISTAQAEPSRSTPGPAEAFPVDRLWTLRRSVEAQLPGLSQGLAAEVAQPMLGPAPANPNKETPNASDVRTVDGRGGVKMQLTEDGSIERFEHPKPSAGIVVNPFVGVGIGGKFDLTDELMRAAGMNPYRYEQHRLAEETREDRLCRMRETQKLTEHDALLRLDGKLQTVWNTPKLPAPQRRKLLFELWDECREEEPDAGAKSALAVRATIEAFIRKKLPKNGDHAYQHHEIAMLNKFRSSIRVFDPYGTGTTKSHTPDAGVL